MCWLNPRDNGTVAQTPLSSLAPLRSKVRETLLDTVAQITSERAGSTDSASQHSISMLNAHQKEFRETYCV